MAIGLTRWRLTIAECSHDPARTWQLVLASSGAVEKAGLLLYDAVRIKQAGQVRRNGRARPTLDWGGAMCRGYEHDDLPCDAASGGGCR